MSMRILLILSFCCCTFSALLAQASFSWGLSLYPSLSDRRLINTGGRLSEKAAADLDQLKKSVFSYAGGLELQWQGEAVGLSLGLRYRNAGYRAGRTLVLPDDPNSDFADEAEARFRQSAAEVPVDMLFFFGLDDKSALFFSMGVSFQYALQSENELTFYRNGVAETRIEDPRYDFRPFNYAFQTGMGWQTQLSDNLVLSIQPHFQFWFKGIYEDRAEINRNLYNLGIRMGLRFWRAVEK